MVSVGTLKSRKDHDLICGLTKVRQADGDSLLARMPLADGYQPEPTETGKQ